MKLKVVAIFFENMKNIKFKYINKDTRIPKVLVEFRHNGNINRAYFIIDLGSDVSVIFSDEKIKHKVLEVCKIGGVDYHSEINFQVLNSNKLDTISCQGVIGLSFISKSNLMLNFKEMELSFNVDLSQKKLYIPSFFIDNYLIVELDIKNKKYNLLYDAGSSYDLILFQGRTNDIANDIKPDKEEESIGFSNIHYKIKSYNHAIDIKNETLNLRTNIKIMEENNMSNQTPKFINGIIGNDFFSNNQILIDYKNQKFYLV